MPGSDTPTPSGPRRLGASRSDRPAAAWMLTLRRPLILVAHIVAFSASLMVSFLVANRMEFGREWLVQQYPLLLFAFLGI